jgi:hypothetical protein
MSYGTVYSRWASAEYLDPFPDKAGSGPSCRKEGTNSLAYSISSDLDLDPEPPILKCRVRIRSKMERLRQHRTEDSPEVLICSEVQVRKCCTFRHRWARLLKEQSSITVIICHTEENKLQKKMEVCRFCFLYIHIYINIETAAYIQYIYIYTYMYLYMRPFQTETAAQAIFHNLFTVC